jgi:hypothetical protein
MFIKFILTGVLFLYFPGLISENKNHCKSSPVTVSHMDELAAHPLIRLALF